MDNFLLKIKIYPDGNSYCALIGKNMQDGIAGFGESPLFAFYNLCQNISKVPFEKFNELELSTKILKKTKNFTPSND